MKRPIKSVSLDSLGVSAAYQNNALDTVERILEFIDRGSLVEGDAVDIEKLIRTSDELELEFADMGDLDASIRKSGNKYIITVNSKHSKKRQRFSMAHEYAHYQLHRSHLESLAEGEKIMHRSSARDSREYQANSLAADLLMPRSKFLSVAGRMNNSASRISDAFNVSLEAVRVRASQLNMVLDV